MTGEEVLLDVGTTKSFSNSKRRCGQLDMYPGLLSALATQDEVDDEGTSYFADEGDKLCLIFDGHDTTEVINLPGSRILYPETV